MKKDGLTSRWINNIYQGKHGFVWMTSEFGLNRYDGYKIQTISQEKQGLHSNENHYLFFTPDSFVAVLNQPINGQIKGIDVVHPLSLEVQAWEEYIDAPFELHEVYKIYGAGQSGTLFLMHSGLLYNFNEHGFEALFKVNTHHELLNLLQTDDGIIWQIVQDKAQTSLQLYAENGQQIEAFQLPAGAMNFTMYKCNSNSIYLSYRLNDRIYYAIKTSTQALHYIDIEVMQKWQSQSIFSRYHQLIFVRDGKSLKVFDLNGQLCYREWGFFKRYKFETYQELPNGDIWFCSGSEGAVQLSVQSFFPFQKIMYNFKQNNRNFGVRNIIHKGANQLLVNGSAGTFVYDLKNDTFSRLDDAYHAYDNQILTERLGLLQDSEGAIWAGNEFEQLYYFSNKYNRTKVYEHSIMPAPKMYWALHEDSRKNIWLGHNSGLSYVDRQNERLVAFNNYNAFSSLQNSTVYHLHENKAGIWVASSTGLYLLDLDKGIVAHPKLPIDVIAHIHEDSAGVFWLSSKGGGLLKYNPQTTQVEQYSSNNGLSDNVIYAAIEDEQQQLWLPSNMGLMCFDKATQKVRTFLESDGISHDEFNTGSYLKTASGQLFFGGLNGITAFYPGKAMQANNLLDKAPLYITSVQKRIEQTGLFRSYLQQYLQQQFIDINTNEKVLKIEFSLLNFNADEQNVYQCKIENFDKEWTNVNGNTLQLNSLPYGDYDLKIKAFRLGNEANATYLSIPLIIHWPFYLSSWFIVLAVGLSFMLIYLIVQWRTYTIVKGQKALELQVQQRTLEINKSRLKIEKQAQELQTINQLKDQLFTNISHELRTPLTLILGPLSKILDNKHQLDDSMSQNLMMMQKNGETLRKIINEILDLAKLDAGKMKLIFNATGAHKFFQDIFKSFEPLAATKNIDFRFTISSSANATINMDQSKVQKIMYNLLLNAIKYSPEKGMVTLKILHENNQLMVQVEDNGPGIAKKDLAFVFDRFYQVPDKIQGAKGGTGVGLALSKELALLMKGDLLVESTLGKGSVFCLKLPFELAQTTLIDTNEAIAETSIAEAIPFDGKPMHILLVEDNKDMQAFVKEVLQEHYQVSCADDGQSAFEMLKSAVAPDLIISDVMMPKMDGFQFISKVRISKKYALTPVIMLTAKTLKKDKIKALNLGVDDYMTKPFSIDELKARVGSLLRNTSARLAWLKEEAAALKTDGPSEQLHNNVLSEQIDSNWIEQLNNCVEKGHVDAEFNVAQLAQDLFLSKRQLERKIKTQTGLSPAKYIQEFRLKRAFDILNSGHYKSVTEVCYKVGFGSLGNFTRVFSKRFGKKPSAFR